MAEAVGLKIGAQVGTLPSGTPLVAVPIGTPSVGAKTLGAVSISAGSILLDAGLGAGIGYLIAPASKKTDYAVGGALATGLFGLLGALGTVAWRYGVDRGK